MTTAATQAAPHIGDSAAMRDHDHDLIHELSKRLDAFWRYDQFIENAKDDDQKRDFWQSLKEQEKQNVDRLRELIKREIENDCF